MAHFTTYNDPVRLTSNCFSFGTKSMLVEASHSSSKRFSPLLIPALEQTALMTPNCLRVASNSESTSFQFETSVLRKSPRVPNSFASAEPPSSFQSPMATFAPCSTQKLEEVLRYIEELAVY